jgi:hypothetical protein
MEVYGDTTALDTVEAASVLACGALS